MDPSIQRIIPGAITPPRVEPRTDRQGGGEGFTDALDDGDEDGTDEEKTTPPRGDRSVSSPDEDEAGRSTCMAESAGYKMNITSWCNLCLHSGT